MARFAITGMRPGETLHANGIQCHTDPTDGGVRLTEEQHKTLTAAGYTLVSIGDAPPPQAPSDDEIKGAANAAQRIAENRAEAEKVSEKAARVPKARKA